MTPLPELSREEMNQFWIIHYWHVACQKGDFEQADRLYELFKQLIKE